MDNTRSREFCLHRAHEARQAAAKQREEAEVLRIDAETMEIRASISTQDAARWTKLACQTGEGS